MTYEIMVFNGVGWKTIARMDGVFPLRIVSDTANSIALYLEDAAQDVAVVDSSTGEILWNFQGMEEDEPYDIDDDCGFDPYMGCYIDDC